MTEIARPAKRVDSGPLVNGTGNGRRQTNQMDL
jgi:hypothetical protein